MPSKPTTIQNHHLIYESDKQKEVTTKIYRSEHWLLTLLNRRTKNISKGLIKSLKLWILLNEDKAVDLDLEFIKLKEKL